MGLVSASWHTNILALSGTTLSSSNFLITCHRQARARPCLPGAFYPDIDPTFLRTPTVLKALHTGNFASGRDLHTDQWQTALTPYHFIVSVPGQTAMPLSAAGFLASQIGTLVSNMGWLFHRIFNDPTLYPDMPPDCSPFLLRSPCLAGLLMQVRTILAQPRVSDIWNAQQASDPPLGLRNTATLLHHLGDLWTLFTDWESNSVPRHHCLIGVPDLHRARGDFTLLSPELLGKTVSFPEKLPREWLADATTWFSPIGLTSPPNHALAFSFPLPALTHPTQLRRRQKAKGGAID